MRNFTYLIFINLKKFTFILLITCFCALPQSLSASTNDANNTTSEKKESTVDPGSSEPSTEEVKEEAIKKNTSLVDGGMYLNQHQDSTNLNSVCKFNFIFYFIYKYKYSEEETGNEFLDFEF